MSDYLYRKRFCLCHDSSVARDWRLHHSRALCIPAAQLGMRPSIRLSVYAIDEREQYFVTRIEIKIKIDPAGLHLQLSANQQHLKKC